VGSWAAIHEINADQADENDNVVLNAEHISIDSQGILIQGNDRLVATVGLEDVIIVDSGDALLVCARDRAQDVKRGRLGQTRSKPRERHTLAGCVTNDSVPIVADGATQFSA
jgi:hypothetical protein